MFYPHSIRSSSAAALTLCLLGALAAAPAYAQAQSDNASPPPYVMTFGEKESPCAAPWAELGAKVGDTVAYVDVDGVRHALVPAEDTTPSSASPADALGGAECTFELKASDAPLRVTLHRRSLPVECAVALSAEVVNAGAQACALGDFELLAMLPVDIGQASGRRGIRAYVSDLCHPSTAALVSREGEPEAPASFDSSAMITLGGGPAAAFTMGFVSAPTHVPIVRVAYAPDTRAIVFTGIARFNGRQLDPGERVETGWLMVRPDRDPFSALETYGDIMARLTPPRGTPAPAGWCSWYAIRMPIDHAFTLANARVMAEHFGGLGMRLMLLDHGWQAGDICGDWDVDTKAFPRGLEGLAADLRGLGLDLGLWIAPTDIAQTSRLFQAHPDWMLRDASGNPNVSWQWFWEPKPMEYAIDATQPEAYAYLVDTFRRLTGAGANYFKIDFIAACAREDMRPADPHGVRGWAPLERAMQAIREGSGANAYIRYCQTPPLLSLGVADGVFATTDTLDAGTSTWPTLRGVFINTSAQYWIHGRLYNHDACDLSVRANGGTEECRLRATMLALSGSSMIFSDDMTKLPEERIRLMQQSLPGFERAARPLNLFEAENPDIWHMHFAKCGLEWDVVALFNLGDAERSFTIEWTKLGLPQGRRCALREFWTGAYDATADQATVAVPGLAVRLYAIWPELARPQFAGTDLHLAQGYAELEDIAWEEATGVLRGTLKRAPGITGTLYFLVPEGWRCLEASHPRRHVMGTLHALDVRFEQDTLAWQIRFERAPQ